MPNGPRVDIQSKRGESYQGTTDHYFYEDPGPVKIPRILQANQAGMVTGDDNSMPTQQEIVLVGHTNLTKITYPAPAGVGGFTSDDTMQINSPTAGIPF